MAVEEDFWRGRANSAEAKAGTQQAAIDRLKEQNRRLLEIFGAKENTDGTFTINYEKLVNMLDMPSALELRSVIDETHRISGAAGEKPRVRLPARAAAG